MNLIPSIFAFTLILFSQITACSAEEKSVNTGQTKPTYVFSGKEGVTSFPNDDATRKIFAQGALLDEGKALERKGLFEEAIEKYKQAMHPSLLNYDYDAAVPEGRIINAYIKMGKYQLALPHLDKYLRNNPYNDSPQVRHRELQALIKARDTGSPQPIYDHIAYLKQRYKKFLPPKAASSIRASTIIRLYDTIGDYDAGIAFVDEFIQYYAKLWGVKPEQIGNKNQYFQINQAFLQDKAEGTKGRATQALIDSDYFPW